MNPVIRQQEALAAEMNAAPAPASPAEAYILGGDEAPVVDEEPLPDPGCRSVRSRNRSSTAPQPEPQRRWGLFGAKKPKEESRMEPAALPIQRNTLQPRASAQVMTRAQQPAEQQRPAVEANDLFPDHKRDEQFEIPAFLRRQSN